LISLSNEILARDSPPALPSAASTGGNAPFCEVATRQRLLLKLYAGQARRYSPACHCFATVTCRFFNNAKLSHRSNPVFRLACDK
jgi:hypothetical protein